MKLTKQNLIIMPSGFVIEDDGTVASAMDSSSTDNPKGISYTETIPILLKAIQELAAKVEALESA